MSMMMLCLSPANFGSSAKLLGKLHARPSINIAASSGSFLLCREYRRGAKPKQYLTKVVQTDGSMYYYKNSHNQEWIFNRLDYLNDGEGSRVKKVATIDTTGAIGRFKEKYRA
eukprot:Nk52_evm54s352 gene=Nk52_evmTU54s352